VTLVRDFVLRPEEASVSLLGPGSLARPGVQRRYVAALDDLLRLAEPAAAYELHEIEALMHDRLQVAGGLKLGCGAVSAVVAGAEQLYVGVCTLGQALDARIREHGAAGRQLEMLLLDELASWAVDAVRTQLYERIRAGLGTRGLRASSPLSPGESSWPIREQRKLFKLVDAAALGITLERNDLMTPMKSLTLAFGAGSKEMGHEGLHACELCSISDRCRYSAERSRSQPRAAVGNPG
jgi:hypothetical protein